MTDGSPAPEAEHSASPQTAGIKAATAFGLGACLVLLAIGIDRMVEREPVGCVDVEDFDCYRYPQLAAGAGQVATAVALACLVLLASMIAHRIFAGREA